jgi:endonuclease YncB( thermonuclease family)
MSHTGRHGGRRPALPRCAAALVSALALVAMAAGGAPAAETTGPPSQPPPPSAPAFYTFSMSRIRNIEGDSFDFERDNGKRLRVRLAWADCMGVSDRLRGHAETIARSILETAPVWVFPCGRPKGVADEVWACVWTDKGWLSEVLVRAGYAARRAPPDAASLEAFDPAGTTNKAPPPPAPAFASTACKVVEGDVFEVMQGSRAQPVRLFDVTCTGVDEPPHDAAKAAAQQCLGEGMVWVFPSSPPKPGDDLRVRLWTSKGWLSHVLLDQKLAVAYADPLKPDTETAGPKPKPQPAKGDDPKEPPAPRKGRPSDTAPKADEIKWRPISIAAAKVFEGGMQGAETGTFQVPSGIWRVSWNCKPPKAGFRVLLNVYRVDEKWSSRVSSHHVTTLKGESGSSVLRTGPGEYWIKLACSAEVEGIKVELGEPSKP